MRLLCLEAKRVKLEEEQAAEEHRRATLETVVPDLLRNNEDMNTDDPTDTSASNDYLTFG